MNERTTLNELPGRDPHSPHRGSEMALRTIRVALLLASLPVAGCGTVANLARPGPEGGGKVPFGGVKQDVSCIQSASNGEFGLRAHPRSESEHYSHVALTVFCAVDLPFSLLGDVVTWPYTVVYSAINQPVPAPPVIEIPPAPGTPPAPVPAPPVIQPMPIPAPVAVPPAAGGPRQLK